MRLSGPIFSAPSAPLREHSTHTSQHVRCTLYAVRPRPAFSLVESIAALVILTLAIPPMVWALRASGAHRADAVLASRAHWLAREKLEDILADRHSTTRGYAFIDPTNYPEENPVPPFTGFRRTVAVHETAADLSSPGTGFKTVTVAVAYTDAAGKSETLSLQSVVTDYTP